MQKNSEHLVNINDLEGGDTSSSAMTELALALCMAFFALLVLALVSVSLPKSVVLEPSLTNKNSNDMVYRDLAQDESFELSASHQQASGTQQAELKLVIYWAGAFIDQGKNTLSIDTLKDEKSLVIAVDPNTPFTKLRAIQQEFSGKAIKLTALSEEWLVFLSSPHVADNKRVHQ